MKEDDKNAMKRSKVKDIVHKILGKDKKKKLKQKDLFDTKKKDGKIYTKLPTNSHLMSDGKTIMSGKTHSKNSSLLGKLKRKKQTYNPISKKKY
tara:strand:- start:1757 stop:2038 length:282 start_codon:yes stop_codon:yes gene_type:complete